MKQILSWLVVLVGLAILVMLALSNLNESRANKYQSQATFERAKGESRAIILEAQGQSRLDSAQASAVNLGAMLPYMIIGIAAVFVSLCLVVVVYLSRPNQHTIQPKVIERVIVFLPATSRREMFETINKQTIKYLKD